MNALSMFRRLLALRIPVETHSSALVNVRADGLPMNFSYSHRIWFNLGPENTCRVDEWRIDRVEPLSSEWTVVDVEIRSEDEAVELLKRLIDEYHLEKVGE